MSVDNVNSKRSLLENINKIANTDKLSDFVDKCNDNFTAIVKNGGGPKGDRGVKGDQGNPTKPKVPIHVWKKDVDYESETQTETGFEITYEDDILSDVKYQENHLILLENTHVYKLVLDLDTNTLKPKFVFELQYFNPDDIKKTNLHIACADSYDGNEYDGFEVMTNTLKPIQKPYVGICINDDDEDSESLNNPLIYNWIYIGGFGSGPGDSGGPGSGPGDSGGPGSGPGDSGGPGSDSGGGKCIYVTLLNDNGSFIYSDINSSEPISDPVSTIARLEINGEPVSDGVNWSCYPFTNVTSPNGEEKYENGVYIGQEFVVTGISGNKMSDSLTITATYGVQKYSKVFSLRKYINESIYDIKPTVNTLTLLDTLSDESDTKSIDIYFQIKETNTNNKHIYYPREKNDLIFGDNKVLNLSIELIQVTNNGIKLVQLENTNDYTFYKIDIVGNTVGDIVGDTVGDTVGYYYKLNITDVNTLKDYNTLRININKNSSDFKEYEDISIVSIESSLDLDINAGFKSTVFTRSDTKPATPRGGTWEKPRPTNEDGTFDTIWSDGIPEGIETLWSSWKIFKSNDNKPWSEDYWSKPEKMVDTSSFEVIFSTFENAIDLSSYTPPKYPVYDKASGTTENYWTDDVTDSKNTLWMATATCNNGVWSQWNASYIKGEKGDNGTSISIEGSGRKVDALPENNKGGNVVLLTTHKEPIDGVDKTIPWIYLWNKDANNDRGEWVKYDGNEGEAYVIDGELYVWDGDTWDNCGRFKGDKGDKGDNIYLHIKYANDAPTGAKNTFTITIDESNIKVVPTGGGGENPGKYIGICTSTSATRPTDPNPSDSRYKWSKWEGEDGWGYDYIYCLTDTYDAPTVPGCNGPYVTNGADFTVKDSVTIDSVIKPRTLTWKDDPQEVDKDNPYCWVCYSQFINGAWTKYKGNSNKPGKGVIWSKWSKDGEGKDIRLDLDNQNDFLIYNNSGERVSESVSTTAKLYENGVPVLAKFSISSSDIYGCTIDTKKSDITSSETHYSKQAKVVVNGLENGVVSGYVKIKATYDGKDYYAKFNVKRLISQNKYQLIVSPTAISYDDDENITKEVTIQVRKTDGSTGESAIMETFKNTGFQLCYKYYENDNYKNDPVEYSLNYTESGATLDWSSESFNTSNIQILLKEHKGASKYFTWDSEDIPIFKGGKTGKSGKIPYYAGEYKSKTYEQTPTATPYVFYNAGSNNPESGYYLLISDSSKGCEPTDEDYWQKMTEFDAIYSNVGVIKQALVGNAVFHGDWIFSQNGCKYEKNVAPNESAKNDYYMEEGFNLYDDELIKKGINKIDTDKGFIQTNRQLLIYNDDYFKTYNSLIGEPYTYFDILEYKPVNFPIGSEILSAVCTGYYVLYNGSETYSVSLYINIKYNENGDLENILKKPQNGNKFLFAHIGFSTDNNLTKQFGTKTINGNTIYTWNRYPVYAFYYDDVTKRAGCVKARRFYTETYKYPQMLPTNVTNINYDTIKINDSEKYYVYGITDSNNKVKLKWQSYLLKINKTSNNNYSKFDPNVKDIRLSDNFSPNWAVNLKTGSMWTGGGSNCMLADGSGSLAGGKISWDVTGNLYLPPTGTLNLNSNPGDTALTFNYYVANGTSLTPAGPINVQIKIRAVYSDGTYTEIITEPFNHSAVENFPFSNRWIVSVVSISNEIINNQITDYDRIAATLYIDNTPSQEIDITKYIVQVFTYNLTKERYMSIRMNIQLCGYIDEKGIGKLGQNDRIYDKVKPLQSVGGLRGASFSDNVIEESVHETFDKTFGNTIDFNNVICVLKLQHVVDDVNSPEFKAKPATIKLGTNADSLFDFGTKGTDRWNTNDNSVTEFDLNIPVVSRYDDDNWHYIGIKPTDGLSSGFGKVHALLVKQDE